MQIHAGRQVRHDLLINPASDEDAVRLLSSRIEALAHEHHGAETDPLRTLMMRMKHMAAWTYDDAAFASPLYRAPSAGFVLEMISDHPDHADVNRSGFPGGS